MRSQPFRAMCSNNAVTCICLLPNVRLFRCFQSFKVTSRTRESNDLDMPGGTKVRGRSQQCRRRAWKQEQNERLESRRAWKPEQVKCHHIFCRRWSTSIAVWDHVNYPCTIYKLIQNISIDHETTCTALRESISFLPCPLHAAHQNVVARFLLTEPREWRKQLSQ